MAEYMTRKGERYKTSGRDLQASRRRRAEDIVELRKAKKDRDMVRRRHIEQDDSIGPRPDDATIQEKLHQISILLNSGNPKELLEGLGLARSMIDFSSHPPLFQELISSGLVPACIQYLRSSDDILRFEAATIIINITSDKFEYVVYVMELGVIPLLYDALKNSKGRRTVARVLWAMGNILGDNIPVRDKFIQDGMIEVFLQLGATPLPAANVYGEHGFRATLEMLRCVCWALGRILHGKSSPPDDVVTKLIPMICHFFGQDDQELLKYSLMAIQGIVACGKRHVETMLNQLELILPRLTFILTSGDMDFVRPCVSIVGRIAMHGTYEQIFELVRNGQVLNSLKNLLSCEDMHVVKDCVIAIGELALDPTPEEVIPELIRLGIAPTLMRLIGMASESLRSEIISALANISARCFPEEIMYLHAYDVCRAFCSGLRSRNLNIVRDSLDGIKLMLQATQSHPDDFAKIKETVEECGGLEAIEGFQSERNEQISKAAGMILDDFFSDAGDHATDLDSMEGEIWAGPNPPTTLIGKLRQPPPPLQIFPRPPTFLSNALPSPFLTPGPGLFAFTPANPSPAPCFTFDDNRSND